MCCLFTENKHKSVSLCATLVSHLDVHQTGDQDVAYLIPAGSGNNLHEVFPTFILSLPLIQEGQLSGFDERMCTHWLTALTTEPALVR